MSLPIRISLLQKIKYGMAFFAGLFLLSFPAKTFYHSFFHPIENVTMSQLRDKAMRGEKFYYLRITDASYNIPEARQHKHWYVVPLRYTGDSDFQLIYVNQDASMSDPITNRDTAAVPEGLSREILVADMSLNPVNGNIRDGLIRFIDNEIEGPYIAFEEYEEPIIWLDILIAIAGTALMYVSIRVVFSKGSNETV